MPTKKYGRKRRVIRRSRIGRLARSRNSLIKAAGIKWSKGMVVSQPGAKRPFGRSTLGHTLHLDGKPLPSRSFMPPSYVTQHRYCERLINLSPDNITGLTGSEYAFRLGSLFDPDFTGTGHQPWGFDQLAAIYQQYNVYRVKIQVKVVTANYGGGTSIPFLAVNLRPNGSAYNLNSKYGWEIQERSGNTVINCNRSAETDIAWETDVFLADIEGLTKEEYTSDTAYKAYSTASPQKTPYMSIACGSFNEVAGASVAVMVSFVFYTNWTSPVVPGQS